MTDIVEVEDIINTIAHCLNLSNIFLFLAQQILHLINLQQFLSLKSNSCIKISNQLLLSSLKIVNQNSNTILDMLHLAVPTLFQSIVNKSGKSLLTKFLLAIFELLIDFK